jgi:tetratricopeptide (TPR) repeat protein
MLQEGRGDWAAAEAVYDGILARAPAYEGAHKRKVALLSGQGRLAQAASALVAYLETFQSDLDAWAELADIYSSLGLYRQAAFCLEELLGAGACTLARAHILR